MSGQFPAPISPTRTRIGWIGIGVMGGAMAARLISAGYSVTLYARSPSKATALLSAGAKLADSPAELAAACDVVFTMIGHPSDVKALVLDTLLPSLNSSTVIVDHTSSHPALARQIHQSALDRRCYAVDAPVSGGDVGARTGKLAIFAGGDGEVVEWLTPLFDVLGKATYMGTAGKGQSCKIANQIVVGGGLVGLSEGLVFAEKAGLDKDEFVEAVKGGAAGSMVMELFGKRMIARDFEPGGFAEYMVKDLGMGVDDDGVVLPGAALSKQLFSGMVANGDGKLGTQGVITVIERINGMGGEERERGRDNVRGKNQEKPAVWSRVHALYHEAQAKNPDEIRPRTIESLKDRFNRLSENADKWVAAMEEANRRKRRGMSLKDIEMEAHKIYEAGGSKFQDLVVYNEVMSKHPRWALSFRNDVTRFRPEDDDDEESAGSIKRSRTSENGEHHIPSNPETPTTKGSTPPRPISRDESRKEKKGKATQSESKFDTQLRELRLAIDSENGLIAQKLELERQKLQMDSLKIEKRMLNTLLAKDHLSPIDEEMKRRLMAIVFRQN